MSINIIDLGNSVFDWLEGKKTYVVASSAALTELVRCLDGTLTKQTLIQHLIVLILAITIRHGVSTSAANQAEAVANAILNTKPIDISSVNIDSSEGIFPEPTITESKLEPMHIENGKVVLR